MIRHRTNKAAVTTPKAILPPPCPNRTTTTTGTSAITTLDNPWPAKAIIAATILCLGTAITSLCFQHVSNAAPQYFFAIAVATPLSGLLTYPTIVLGLQYFGYHHSKLTAHLLGSALKYTTGIGACFALANLLVDYGRSGSQAGVPDVSTVLTLILLKLVVPVSLVLESTLERRRPTKYEVSGVMVLLLGVFLTGLIYHHVSSSATSSKSINYTFKIFCLCFASVPLSLGFYGVQVARRRLPQLTGIELWAILCLPELFFSILLCFSSQSSNLRDGMSCVLLAKQESTTAKCPEAALFFWLGLPFGFAFNLAIPILIQLKGSTSVPLFRALALPIAALLAMTPVDPAIHTPFSWDAVLGVVLCTTGLLLFYGPDVQQLVYNSGRERAPTKDRGDYSAIPDGDEVMEVV